MPDMPGQWREAQRDAWEAQRETLGAFIRERRKQANLSLRQLAELTSLSNPYLSQVERGLHQPSVRVLKAISDALNLSAETLLTQALPHRRHSGGAGRGSERVWRRGPACGPRHRAGDPRGQAPVRGPEVRPDRRIPQHAQPAREHCLTDRERPEVSAGNTGEFDETTAAQHAYVRNNFEVFSEYHRRLVFGPEYRRGRVSRAFCVRGE